MLQGIKIRLTITISSLLLLSMLLVNFVLIIFWQRDALQREVDRDQSLLAIMVDMLPDDISLPSDFSPVPFFFSKVYPQAKDGRILLRLVGDEKAGAVAGSDVYSSILMKSVSEVMHTGQPVHHSSGSFLGLLSFQNQVLVLAQPIVHEGRVVGGLGIVRSLDPMFQTLWRAEKIVLVYILINLLILSVIGFFRMAKLVVRPIERLVRLADQYNDQETVLFASGAPGSEFGKLEGSLNRMLVRIEHDRKSLEKTVEELETVNQKLKTHQQEMIRTEKLASIGRMAAGLAHEIGNPLGVVQGYLGLLGQSDAQSEEHQDFIRRADHELQRIQVLIRQMLDFGRVSKGAFEKQSVHTLLRSVVHMVEVQPVFKNLQLISRLEAEKDCVFADQDQLRQVFVNCLLNSADAVAAAGRGTEGVIVLSTELYDIPGNDSAQHLRVQIRDNGIGISDEQRTVIFDPFFTTKEPGKGTGLGLSVSLSIIESMGGRMEMESTLGQGSVLSVFLPLFSMAATLDQETN